MTARWTDDRIDDLKHQVEDLGRRMDRRFEKVDERFEKVDDRFDKVDDRFDKVDDRFEGVNREIHRTQQMVIGLHATITRLSVTLLAVVAGLVVTRLA